MTQSQDDPTTGAEAQATEEPIQRDVENTLSMMTALAKHNNRILALKNPSAIADLLTYIRQHMDEADLVDIVLQEAYQRSGKSSEQSWEVDLQQLLQEIAKLPPKQRKSVLLALRDAVRTGILHETKEVKTDPEADSESMREYHMALLFDDSPPDELLLASLLLPHETTQQQDARTVRIQIDADPLTAQNLNSAISALTELSTKYWLIAKGRYADLIEYTQTRNNRFVEEANVVITRVSYNSPFNLDLKFDISMPSVAEAIITTIDGFKQQEERLKKAQLENQAKAQQIKEAEQKAEQDKQKAELELAKQQLKLEKQRVELLSMQLDMQKKSFEMALELAGKAVDTLQPGLDPATRAMAIQAILPNLIQLDSVKGLSARLLPAPESKE